MVKDVIAHIAISGALLAIILLIIVFKLPDWLILVLIPVAIGVGYLVHRLTRG